MTRESTVLDHGAARKRRRLSTSLALIATLGAGCAAQVDGEAGTAQPAASAPTDVAGAQQYLQTYGYLPSDELRERVPNAKVIVDRPFERGVLDEPTRAALAAFQVVSGLPSTGEFDDATRLKMGAWRCGNTDAPSEELGTPDADGLVDKFALQAKLSRGSAIIRVKNYPVSGTISTGKVNADVDGAALEFRRKTGFYMERKPVTTQPASGQWAIDLYFYTGARPSWTHERCPDFINSPTAAATMGLFYRSTGEQVGPIPICINTATPFTFGADPIGSSFDFYSVLLHEFGHATGLDHSSIGAPLMQPFIDPGEFLYFTSDDLQAEWSRWGKWSGQYGGPAGIQQVIWGPGDTLYAIDTYPMPNGNYQMWRRTASNRTSGSLVTGTWTKYDGYGVRLGYDGGRLWHINAQGMMYWRNPEDTGWNFGGSCFRDVSGSDGLWWFAAGCDGDTYFATPGSQFQRLSRVGSGAVRLAYDRKNNNLWQIDASGRLYKGIDSFTLVTSGMKDVNIGHDAAASVWAVTTTNKARLLSRQPGIPELDSNGVQKRDARGELLWHAPPKNEFVPFIDSVSVKSIAGDGWGYPAMADTNSRLHDIRLFYTN